MALNWVSIPDAPAVKSETDEELDLGRDLYVPMGDERTLILSPFRTTFSLQTRVAEFSTKPLHLDSATGTAILTTKRVIYIPSPPTAGNKFITAGQMGNKRVSSGPIFQSFSVEFARIISPHIHGIMYPGSSVVFLIHPLPNGGIPAKHGPVEVRMAFKDGGATHFLRHMKRLRHYEMSAGEPYGFTVPREDLVGENLPNYQERYHPPGMSREAYGFYDDEREYLLGH